MMLVVSYVRKACLRTHLREQCREPNNKASSLTDNVFHNATLVSCFQRTNGGYTNEQRGWNRLRGFWHTDAPRGPNPVLHISVVSSAAVCASRDMGAKHSRSTCFGRPDDPSSARHARDPVASRPQNSTQRNAAAEAGALRTSVGGSNTIPTRPHPELGQAHRARMDLDSAQRATVGQAGSSSAEAQLS